MATIKSTFKRFNGTDFDIHLFETSADLISETTSFKVLTSDERTQISDFLTTFNTANKLVRLDGDGVIPIGLIPGGLDFLPINNPAFTGILVGNTINSTAGANLIINRKGTTGEAATGGGIELRDDEIHFNLNGTQDQFVYRESSGGGEIDLLGGNILTGLITPVANSDAATKAYVDVVVGEGVKPVAPVVAATTANITLSGTQTVDGIALDVDDRVLVKEQSTASQNGIYLVKSGAWVKVAADSVKGILVFVANGTQNNDSKFFATDDTTWILFSRTDTITAGAGLTKTGTELSIANGAITNAMLAGSINQSKILNFSADKTASPDQSYGDNSNAFSLKAHMDQIASFLNRLRGDSAEDLTNTLPITLAGAALKNRTFVEASNPSTTGKVTGDLVFQTLT